MDEFNEENFSAWGMPAQRKEEEYPERYDPPSKTEQINNLLDEYLKAKLDLDKIKDKKGAEEISKVYDKILKNLEGEINKIK